MMSKQSQTKGLGHPIARNAETFEKVARLTIKMPKASRGREGYLLPR